MEHTCACADMQSYVNIRCHLKTFQALSTNFGDNPRIMLFLPIIFSYVAKDYYESNPVLKQVLDQIKSGYFTPDEPTLFHDIYNSLVYHDRYVYLLPYIFC